VPTDRASEPVTIGELSATASAITKTPIIQGGRIDSDTNIEAASSQITTIDTVAGDAAETLTAKIDDETSRKVLDGRANMNPFVAVNAVFNVPAQMLRCAKVCTLADARAPMTEEEQTTTTTTRDVSVETAATLTTNEWGRHGYIVAEIHKVLAVMEPPWGSLQVFEAVSRQFPEVDKTALQMAVLAVLMTQGQWVRELTLAGARKGPRRDENGEIFIELDLIYANRLSDSY